MPRRLHPLSRFGIQRQPQLLHLTCRLPLVVLRSTASADTRWFRASSPTVRAAASDSVACAALTNLASMFARRLSRLSSCAALAAASLVTASCIAASAQARFATTADVTSSILT